MDELLHDLVAGQPIEVVPVAHLELHFGPARFALDGAVGSDDVGLLDRGDVTDSAVPDAIDRLAHERRVAPAEAGDDGSALSFWRPRRWP